MIIKSLNDFVMDEGELELLSLDIVCNNDANGYRLPTETESGSIVPILWCIPQVLG